MQIKTVVFMGTSKFAVPALKLLATAKFRPALCITQPDRPKGRNQRLGRTEVKKAAIELDLPVYQPEDVNAADSLAEIEALDPDIIITVAYGGYIKRKLRLMPSLGCINLHPSLLPQYRGAAPINFTLFNGDILTGNTIFKIVARMDAGPILYQSKTEIAAKDNYSTLSDKLALQGARDLVEVLNLLEKDKIIPRNQDEDNVTFSRKLEKSDFRIDWKCDSTKIRNRIRGLAEKPGAYTVFRDKQLKILAASELREKTDSEPGTIIGISGKSGIIVSTGSKDLLIESVQPAGKKIMAAYQFDLGARINSGERFSDGI